MQWAKVKGFGGRYYVSTNGDVRRVDDVKAYERPNGAKAVNLFTEDGKHHTVEVHRLMAEAFLPKPKDGRFVLFRDGDKRHLRVKNLVWSSTKAGTAK